MCEYASGARDQAAKTVVNAQFEDRMCARICPRHCLQQAGLVIRRGRVGVVWGLLFALLLELFNKESWMEHSAKML